MWTRNTSTSTERGGALLAVLWLSAALASVAFALATTVRGEAERASTLAESVRAQYLATAGVDGAVLTMAYGQRATPADYPPLYRFRFPSGETVVEVIPETARLSLNEATFEDFYRLLMALGAGPERAGEISSALIDWRGPGGAYDTYYASLVPSFRARHASFEEAEEALLVKGMTPALFHGNYGRDGQGRLLRLGAFKDCVSVFGTTKQFDINGAEPALLVSLGVPRENLEQVLEARRRSPVRNAGELAGLRGLVGDAYPKLRVGGNSIYTLRATARLNNADGELSDLSRTVSAQVKIFPQGAEPAYHILRWQDSAATEVARWQ